jgi:carbamoyltransferase
MFTLGFAGGLDVIHERRLDTPENYTYDGAAVLLEDGVVVAALEEERLDRIKHSNKFPIKSIRFCLESRGLHLSDLSSIAYYVDEASADALLARMYLSRPDFQRRIDARTLMRAMLSEAFDCEVEPSKLRFYEHKLTHAACAMYQSGFQQALVYVIDNAGALYSGRRASDGHVSLDTLAFTPPSKSLQKFCHAILPFLGLGMFEEYKALALAPLGNPVAFDARLAQLYDLLPDGEYRLHLDRASALIDHIEIPRAGIELSSPHHDLAAALQRAMERIVLHVLRHYQSVTGLRQLCVAGGMAENVATNACILYSGLFDDAFVHPAAYDSGCALGAALLASQDDGRPVPKTRVESVNWGSTIGGASEISAELMRWSGFIQLDRVENGASHAAKLISEGALIGWVEGHSDFGSRALGGRNALTDARVADNRTRLHKALGRHETYRPLALLIKEEDLREWCELPPGCDALPFQSFAVRVAPSKRNRIAAALRPDGRACLQTVSRRIRPGLWSLLDRLGKLTGSPAVLSASFNRSSEPAVETIEQAASCFIGSGLDYLVANEVVATKTHATRASWTSLHLSLPPYAQLVRIRGWPEHRGCLMRDEISTTCAPASRKQVSRVLADLLMGLEKDTRLGDFLSRAGLNSDQEFRLMSEIIALSSIGLIVLRPPLTAGEKHDF